MILTIDIGNTNIVLGCIDGDKTLFVERLSTVRTKTELEYAIDIKNVLDIYHIHRDEIEGGIISSVVPAVLQPSLKLGGREDPEEECSCCRSRNQDRIEYPDG